MNAKTVLMGLLLGMVGSYLLAVISAKAGPLPGLKA